MSWPGLSRSTAGPKPTADRRPPLGSADHRERMVGTVDVVGRPRTRVARPLREMAARSTLGPCPTRDRPSDSTAVSVGRWDIALRRRRVPVHGAPPHHEKIASSIGTALCRSSDCRPADPPAANVGRLKAKARRALPLPLSTYSAPGGLPQDPGHGAESSADATTSRNESAACVCLLSTYRGRGDVEPAVGPAVGPAVQLRVIGEVQECAPPGWAEQSADSSEGRQPGMRTCST